MGVTLHPQPDAALRQLHFHSSGDVLPLSTLQYAIASTDGGQVGTALGSGFALWHPDLGDVLPLLVRAAYLWRTLP